MLRAMRRATFHVLRNSGVFRFVERSRFRRNRLLILCYHGISRYDEHLWRPSLYMQPAVFARRLEILKDGGYRVLALGEALRRLQAVELPGKSTVLTFDDGGFDFYQAVFPLIRRHGFP